MQKSLVFTKTSKRRLAGDNITKQLEYVKYRAIHGGRVDKGWLADLTSPQETENLPEIPLNADGEENKSTFTYTVNLNIGCRSKRARRDDVVGLEFEHIKKMVQTSAKCKGWDLVGVEDLCKDYEFSYSARDVVVPPKQPKKVKKELEVVSEVASEVVVEETVSV